MTETIEQALPGRRIPAGWLVTARSHFIDRYRAECEIVALPARSAEGGPLRVESGAIVARPPEKRFRLPPRRVAAPPDRWIVDLRRHTPSNWSHFLDNHLPLFFELARLTGRPVERALALLPTDIPAYIRDAAAVFGLETWTTDDIVSGDGVAVGDWSFIRGARSIWAASAEPQRRLARALAAAAPASLPRRIFLSRRDSRLAGNADEIEARLAARGFETVFPETLPVIEQFRLFRGAEEIVAIHGAGIAPLIYCRPGEGPRRLLEILPAGLMSDAFREMAGHAGCAWVGVRGRIKPEYVAPAYDLDTPMRQFSFDDFVIDPASVDLAFDMFDHPPPSFGTAALNQP